MFCERNRLTTPTRLFGASYERAALPARFYLLTLQGRECVSGLKVIVKCDDSFEFLTPSDKWLHRALHELLAVILALIIF